MATGKNKTHNIRQSATSRLPIFWKRKISLGKNKKIRVKRYRVYLTGSREITLCFRKFTTKKANRSSRINQIVLPFRLFAYKELAVVYKHKKRRAAKHAKLLLSQSRALAIAIMLIGLTGLVYFGLNINKPRVFEPIASNAHVSAQTVEPASKSFIRSLPTRLRIPKIGVDTPLVQLGKNADGSMETPTDISTAGWYKYSPTPGQLGPSIITGHVDSYRGIAVFFHLRELQPGDTIEVDRADGRTVKFQVTKVDIYSKKAFPTSEVYGNVNYSGIRLITCGGTFDRHVFDYDSNIVVYGSLM